MSFDGVGQIIISSDYDGDSGLGISAKGDNIEAILQAMFISLIETVTLVFPEI